MIMKNVKFIFSTLLALFVFNVTQAQTAEEAQKKAVERAMAYGKNKVDASQIPAKYSFSWKYSLEIKTDSGKAIDVDYLLEPNSPYYGTSMNKAGSNMFMIMDTKNKLMVSTFDKGAKKMAMASKIPDYDIKGTTKDSKYTYKTLPNKVILGFNCKGMQATNATSNIIFYYTTEAKVGFAELFKSQQNQNLSGAFSSFFKSGEKPLMMSMEFTDLKKNGKKMTMTCVGLKKEAFTFNKSDYQFM